MDLSQTIGLAKGQLLAWEKSRKIPNHNADAELHLLLQTLVAALEHAQKEIEELKQAGNKGTP